MASVKEEQFQEPDRYPGTLHPREQSILIGHEHAEQAVIESLKQKRFHHAWLISGKEGVGKATFAYRIARYLLDVPLKDLQNTYSLEVTPESFAARQVEALSHPNLCVLRRGQSQDGKVSSIISVEAARKALSLFESTAVGEHYRICIVDSADDLNIASANALLKMIEEPPPNSLFLLISHAPHRLLPTIRSRCRKLAFKPLSTTEMRDVILSLGEPWISTEPEKMEQAIHNGEGSVKLTLSMLEAGNLALVQSVEKILSSLPSKDDRAILALAETLSRRDNENQTNLVFDTLQLWLSHKISELVTRPEKQQFLLSNCVSLGESIEKAVQDIQTATLYNLDRRPVFLNLFDELANTIKKNSVP